MNTESLIYADIKSVVRKIYNHTNIRVEKIEIDWIDISTHGQQAFMVNEIKINSTVKIEDI